jgi:hypothetical protein
MSILSFRRFETLAFEAFENGGLMASEAGPGSATSCSKGDSTDYGNLGPTPRLLSASGIKTYLSPGGDCERSCRTYVPGPSRRQVDRLSPLILGWEADGVWVESLRPLNSTRD